MATVTGFPPAQPPSYNCNNASYNLSSFSGYNPTSTNNTIMPASQPGYTSLFPPYNHGPQPPPELYSHYTHYGQYSAHDNDIGPPDSTGGPVKSEESPSR